MKQQVLNRLNTYSGQLSAIAFPTPLRVVTGTAFNDGFKMAKPQATAQDLRASDSTSTALGLGKLARQARATVLDGTG